MDSTIGIRYNILFPYQDKLMYNDLKIDSESISYISTCNQSRIITNIIKNIMKEYFLEPNEINITDMTAGVGGNTISFGLNFAHVNAIELDTMRTEYLRNNVSVYKLGNITIINGDSVYCIEDINHDVIFIDPPWGGFAYKSQDKIRLTLGNIELEDLINLIMTGTINKIIPKLVILKLPKNYDIEYLHHTIVADEINIQQLKKMFIVSIR